MTVSDTTTVYVTCEALSWAGYKIEVALTLSSVPTRLEEIISALPDDYQKHTVRVVAIELIRKIAVYHSEGVPVPDHLS